MAKPKLKPRDIRYLNKDFTSFRDNLIEFSKTYFPKTYSDFNESSPGMLFIEMASYVGDVLSFYVDDTLKESMMIHAQDRRNVLSLSQYLGYKPKVTSPSVTTLTVYQLVPSSGSLGNEVPDPDYYLRIKEGLEVESTSNPDIRFITTETVDFSSPVDREITVHSVNGTTTNVEQFLVTTKVSAISGEIVSEDFEFGSAEPFTTIQLDETDIIQILDITDSDGNRWYEVPYLAQEMVYAEFPNVPERDQELAQFRESVPSILRLLKTPRRYTTKVNEDNTTTITFGTGDPSVSDELIIPNFKNVGLGLRNSISRLEESFDPTNFLKTKTYGQAPSNTTLTVRYVTGGGINSNVPAGDLTRITSIEFENDFTGLDQNNVNLITSVQSSIAVENEVPGVGGRGAETLEEIRENALANFSSQNRAVTRKDYVVRSLAMPPKFGTISKAYASPDSELDINDVESILKSHDVFEEFTDLVLDFVNLEEKPTEGEIKQELLGLLEGRKKSFNDKLNPFAVNLYILGYDGDKNLAELNLAIKENLKTYLNEYRILTDSVNIIDGFIVNIGIDFEIITYPNYNKREVLLDCIEELREYFNIDNWTFNMPINLSEVGLVISRIDGVSSVSNLEVTNKCGGDYSPNAYNIEAAKRNNIIYPSLDPCVFEVKFPNRDIKGRAL